MRNGHFNGMPTTMAGLLTASLVVVFHQLNIANASTSLISTTGTSKIIALIILAVVLMNSLLMVSNVKFATFDTFFFRGSNTPVRIAISLLILAGVAFYPGQAIIFIGLIYICESLMRYSWIKPEKQRGI